MSNKQSSVDWLISQLKISTYWNNLISELELMECGEIDILEQAKAMHKEEMINAINNISEKNIKYANNTIIALTKIKGELFMHDKKQAEQYYNETYGGNNE